MGQSHFSIQPAVFPIPARPVLKWAGGKQQLITPLLEHVPKRFNKYIEPFIGGGALFFSLKHQPSIIADSNEELINLYQVIADDVETLTLALQNFANDEDSFYTVRAQDPADMTKVDRAARMVYLNKTCFNGLYRVNKKGQFNVPYGRYKNPTICDTENLRAASKLLEQTTIVHADYKTTLRDHAEAGDLVFLDPPYLPISEYADFKRYTKEQFYEEDQVELAEEVRRLHELGCHVILTNSNHPMIYELYDGFEIKVHQTKRHINKKGNKRTGEDVIVNAPPQQPFLISSRSAMLAEQITQYPSTRYMGSKQKILQSIWEAASWFKTNSVLDLFSGSGVVSYMFKAQGKQVISNDYMAFSSVFTKALVENNSVTLSERDIAKLLGKPNTKHHDNFVAETFQGLYFNDDDNAFIDRLRANIKGLGGESKRALAMSALIRTCMKKRPRGIFTYTGERYNDGRKDLQLSFEEQFLAAVTAFNGAVFDNQKSNTARRGDALSVCYKADLVYIDPPYYSPFSDNEYVRRYHFVEGLACDWQNVEMQWHTKTKKFKSYPTPFSSRTGAHDAFDRLFRKYRDSVLLVSYSSNSQPTKDEMVALMAKYKTRVEVVSVNHTYSFGNQGHKTGNKKNQVKEYLFIGF
ncbi:MAG: Dam family site-specific DNA-(adenine-N6)-methyltransferase [Deinococcota bacterium]